MIKESNLIQKAVRNKKTFVAKACLRLQKLIGENKDRERTIKKLQYKQ